MIQSKAGLGFAGTANTVFGFVSGWVVVSANLAAGFATDYTQKVPNGMSAILLFIPWSIA